MKLSIIIPCFNEEKTIEKIINKINHTCKYAKEIIVIDDKSTDNSLDILNKLLHEKKINLLIKNTKNYGKGYSVKQGILNSKGDIILIQDADLEYDPSDYPKLVEPILSNLADVVFGSRFLGSEIKRVLFFWHSLGNNILTFLSNMFTNLNLTDMENCYKVFRSDIIKKIIIKENRFGIEPEITGKLAALEARFYEVSISYHGRSYSEGKKSELRMALVLFGVS